MTRRVLHLLSQRPSLTGSGVTLDALVRHGARAGWDQWVVVGTPDDDPHPAVGGLAPERVRPLRFGGEALPFSVPGMSDVMPYPSTRFSAMTAEQLRRYRDAWRAHLTRVIDEVRPALIHAHHVWILSGLIKDVAPDLPVVVQCHATGLRQMALCPHLAEEVRRGCARNERFLALQRGHAEALASALALERHRVHQVGAGYRDDLFHMQGRRRAPASLVYVGKYSAAKGLPWLLDALERLPGVRLHVAGSGAGAEADALRRRMEGLDTVELHGQLSQEGLGDLLRRAAVCVLPSFYEGVPLVLAEALACGCRLVATALPGVLDQLAPHLGAYLELVPLPRLEAVDRPVAADTPAFVDALAAAIRAALARGPLAPDDALERALTPFTWSAVFARVEPVWLELLAGQLSVTQDRSIV